MTDTLVELRRIGDVATDAPPAWLHPSEAARYARIGSASRRSAYLAGHRLARELLAARHGGSPEDWPLEERPDRAPRVLPRADLALSISHSGDWIACAIAAHPIGLDIEAAPRRRTLATLAPLLLDDDAPAADFANDDLLLDRWVLKEAWLKRDGEGVGEQRLRAVKLRPGDADATDLLLWRAPTLRLALTACDPAVVALRTTLAFDPPQCWRVA